MRASRITAAALIAAVATVVTGCVLGPPPEHPPHPTAEPSSTSQGRPMTTATPRPLPSAGGGDQGAGAGDRVQPDGPLPALGEDPTAADTGELYAGLPPVTDDGYFPDAPFDMVLPPTRGTPIVAPGIALPATSDGDELLEGAPHTADGNLLLSTVGRLEMSSEAGEFTCSGTVINSASGLVVLTAAHCIFDDDSRDWFDEITFSPGYEDGDAPFGRWTMTERWVPEQYLEANNRWLDGDDDIGWMGFDFGFFRVEAQDGRTLEDVVGGQGVSFTAETNGVVVAGYPGNSPFDAEVLRYCADDELSYGAGDDPNLGVDCDMGSGASGSGWVSNLDPATGAGTVTAVYSNGGEDDAYGPPLGITAWNGLQTVDG